MDRVDTVVRPCVLDTMHFCRVCIYAFYLVPHHGVRLPASLPQFVEDIEVIIGTVITMIVLKLGPGSHSLGGAVEVARHNVPANTAVCEVIQRRHSSGKQK